MTTPRIEIDAFMDGSQLIKEANKIQVSMDRIKTLSEKTGLSTSALNQALKNQTDATKTATASWTEFRSMYSTVLDVMRVGQKVYSETVGKTLELADSVRSLTDVSSASAEDASRFIQVIDDYGLTAQDALTATKALTKQGLEPTLDTIASLSTQYNKLTTEQEKNEFILKNLGKSGLEWARVLGLGEEAIRKLSKEVDKNLILSQKQLDEAEKLRLNTDELKDTWEGLMVTFGSKAIPALNERLSLLNKNMDEHGIAVGYVAALYEFWSGKIKDVFTAEEIASDATLGYSYALQAMNMQTEAAATNQQILNSAVVDSNISLRDSESALSAAKAAYEQFNGELVTAEEQIIQNAEEIHAWGERMYVLKDTAKTTIPPIGEMLRQDARQAEIAKNELEGIRRNMVALDGMESYLDVYIRVHGALPSVGRPGTGGATIQSNYINSGDVLQFGSGGGNAFGGQYTIPPSAGYEGFNLGGLGTASAGEVVTISNPQKGQHPPGGEGGWSMGQMRQFADMLGSVISQRTG